MLSKDAILAASDFRIETVPVPEWSGEVSLRTMTARDRDSYEGSIFLDRKSGTLDYHLFRVKLLVRCICDSQGNRLFGDDETELLASKSAAVIERLHTVAMRLSAITKEDVDGLTKN